MKFDSSDSRMKYEIVAARNATIERLTETVKDLRCQLSVQVDTIKHLRRQLAPAASNNDLTVSAFELCMKYTNDEETKRAIVADFVTNAIK